MALFSSLFRSLTPWATQYKGEVESRLSQILGEPVSIQTMETGWYWFEPVFKLQKVTINKGTSHPLEVGKLLIGINLFKSLWHWRLQPSMLYLDTVHLVVREQETHWTLDGISNRSLENTHWTSENTRSILGWLSQEERLVLKNAVIVFHFKNGKIIPIQDLNVSIINHSGYYKIKGYAQLKQEKSTHFNLVGHLSSKSNDFNSIQGQLYFFAKDLFLAQWQQFFPKIDQQFKDGKGTITAWVDLSNGAISSLQAQIQLKNLVWQLQNSSKNSVIQDLNANIAWKPDAQGWVLQADKVKLKVGEITWPDNQFSLKRDTSQNSYQVFIKSVIIDSILPQAINWPTTLQPAIKLKPQGVLSDTQLLIKDDQAQYLLTRFDRLGWKSNAQLPQVENASGVLSWQPEEGRLELDSEHTSIKFKNYPKQELTLLNGALDWKELSQGLRVSIERLVLSEPELTLSTQGMIDQVSKDSLGFVHLDTEFSAKNVQHLVPFLPKEHMKIKLYNWLKDNLKTIDSISGTMHIKGLAQEFPFDKSNGEFSIDSYASGISLLINAKWPLIKEIEGYIKVKNRDFDADIIHADFQGVPVKEMKVHIADIGHDKENLVVHGSTHSSAQKMLNYVLASPLKGKLQALSQLSMKGLLALNMDVEIPLYPENNINLAKGSLVFKDNTITVQHQLKKLVLKQVSGNLAFNQQGVTQSHLDASAWGYPFTIKIQTLHDPKTVTTIAVNGELALDSLQEQWNLPILSLFKGMFSLDALIKLPADLNNLNSMTLKSSLKGLSIHLPTPLGKTKEAFVPLEVTVDFDSKMNYRLRTNYDNKVSADMMFQDNKGVMELQSGQLRLGSGEALNQNKPSLAIVGSLDGFDLEAWKKVIDDFSTEEEADSWFQKLRIIQVSLGKFTFLKQQWNQLMIKAKRLSEQQWSFNVEQENIAADLTYDKKTDSLSGFIRRLHLNKIDNSDDENELSNANPNQIPNLNLRVDNMSVGDIQIGNMTLKSHSTAERWTIDYCKIESPVYQIHVEGEWNQKGKVNFTKSSVKLHLTDLAKSLKSWAISPVVYAQKGDLEFSGGWKGTPYDFSLASLDGKLFLQLKDGRITHLSPGTEGKMGLGKLLSVLSLQTLPRRLKLDFSDLSHTGYSFDIFKGNFSVKKGIMSTQDSYMDGPVAYASMKGGLDLVRKIYDLNLQIAPHITASLPLVATIAGGPVAGLAAWVANKMIINQSMQKISSYSYKISGPWNEPVVQQLTVVRKKN